VAEYTDDASGGAVVGNVADKARKLELALAEFVSCMVTVTVVVTVEYVELVVTVDLVVLYTQYQYQYVLD
jgi:hypothetical protein